MPSEDQNIEQWVRQLAGDQAAGSSREIEALRVAIRARHEASIAAAANDDLARERLMKRLEQEGLLTDKPRVWQPWIGAVAAALIAVVGSSLWFLPEHSAPVATYRGISGSITLVSDEPEKSVQDVLQQLRGLGFEPRRLDRNDRVIVELEVASDKLAVFQSWAAGKGSALEPGVYRVFVAPKERNRDP